MKKYLILILGVIFALCVNAQSSISFNAKSCRYGMYDEIKSNPDNIPFRRCNVIITINVLQNQIKIGELKYEIQQKKETEDGYLYKCYDAKNVETCWISYTHIGKHKIVSQKKGNYLVTYINQ